MSHFPDLGPRTMVARGTHVRAVGWLHPAHSYNQGDVSPVFLERLKMFVARCSASAEALYFGAFGGIHTCEFCGKEHGASNFGVPAGELLYIAPEMIVHYIEVHAYCPPREFIEAVLRSPLPDTAEYALLARPFYNLHKAEIARIMEAQRRK